MSDIAHYQIRVRGHLSAYWSQWFSGLLLESLADGDTRISGWLPDQSALHGVLALIRDAGLVLMTLERHEMLPAIEGREPGLK